MTSALRDSRPPGRAPSRVSQALAADRLGVWTVVAIVGGAIAPLTVVAGGATTGWAVAKILAIPLAYLVVAVLLMLFSSGYTAMISRGRMSAGPLYTVPARGLGQSVGVGSGLVAILAYVVMEAGLLGGVGAVGAPLLSNKLGWTAPWYTWALLAWAIIGLLGVLNVDLVGKVLAALLAAEVLVAVILAAVMLAHPAGGHVDYTAISPRQVMAAGFFAACTIAVAGFVGFEGTGNLSEESKNPRRTVPRATIAALAITAVLYGGVAFAMVTAAGPGEIIKKATNDGTNTMFNLAAPYVPHWLIVAGYFLLLSSMFASALAFHSLTARYVFTLGREHVLPARLARTSARSNAPVTASLTTTVLALLIVAAYVINGWDPLVRLFFQLTVLGGFGVLILMIISSLATTAHFARRDNRRDGVGIARGVLAPAVSVLALGLVMVETLQQFAILIGISADDPLRWILPGLFAVALAVGLVRALHLRRRRPEVYLAIGTSKAPHEAAAAVPPTALAEGW